MATPSTPTRPAGAAQRVQLQRTFQAPPERLFQAWTTPEELKRWHAPADNTCTLAEVDPRVGGAFRIHMQQPDGKLHRISGTYRVVERPRKLAYTWTWTTDQNLPGEGEETLVTVEFRPSGSGTELVLTHEGLATEHQRGGAQYGWTSMLDKVAGVVA